MEKDYLILDFGKVLAGPRMENWFITPNFFKIVGRDKIELEKFTVALKKYNHYIGMPMKNEADEYMYFFDFYYDMLTELGFEITDAMIEELADDWTFNDDKFKFYPKIKEELSYLNEKYKLLVLSDNWPSVLRIMHNNDTYKYFDRIYVSSIYECIKSEKIFFEYPIKDYNLEGKKTIFVDDDVRNLDVALEMNLTPILMDRDNENPKVKYKTINSLFDL